MKPARGILIMAMIACAGSARTATPVPTGAAQFDALTACRGIAAPQERLACYDAAVAALDTAVKDRQVVVVDREHIRKTKRTLFGLPLPDIKLFGAGDEDLESVDGIIRSAWEVQDGNWRFALQDGAVWEQIDQKPLALEPRSGWPVEIKRATLGSYFMRVRNMPGIRVRRLQ